MIIETSAAETPIILVNARLSERSYLRWKARLPNFVGALLARIDLALAQSQADADRFTLLGAPRVEFAGNLKFDAPAPPADLQELAMLSGRIAGRRVWIAASTHDGEETEIAEAHRVLAARFPELLTLIAPRHPNRGARSRRKPYARADSTARCARRSAEPGCRGDLYLRHDRRTRPLLSTGRRRLPRQIVLPGYGGRRPKPDRAGQARNRDPAWAECRQFR